jgi:oligo-1,6-glucosidase
MPTSRSGSGPWWKSTVVYQVYPASFLDTTGSGTGDIPGLVACLDYIRNDVGAETIWLSPMYASPLVDMGYDISDFEAVDPRFGTMSDMDELIEQCHARGMKLILDLVINHTSDQHKWFQESKKSKDNEYADWYIWKKPKYDENGNRKPPNNWGCAFGGGAWEYVPEREEYYLHLFCPEQPDLNWENPVTRKAVYDSAIEFWLKKGIDGFRVDTVNLYSKDQGFRDAEELQNGEEYQPPWKWVVNGPRIHEFLKEINDKVLSKYRDVMMVGECGLTDEKETLRYISAASKELSMIFDFAICEIGRPNIALKWEAQPWTLPELKKAIHKTQKIVGETDGWPTCFAENHDLPRSIPTYATSDPQYRVKAGRMLAMFLATLSGTLFLYEGQEIGMTNFGPDCVPDRIRDVDSLNYWEKTKNDYPNDSEMWEKAKRGIAKFGRDNARTPMQWSGGKPNAGFTSGEPWIPVMDNYREVNVETERKNDEGVLKMWRDMIDLRRKHEDSFVYGRFELVEMDNKELFMYTKKCEKEEIFVVLNFTSEEVPFQMPEALMGKRMDVLASTSKGEGEKLGPWDGRVYRSSWGDDAGVLN